MSPVAHRLNYFPTTDVGARDSNIESQPWSVF